MKRIKMMLTAVAIITVVGGALAFKSNKFQLDELKCGTSSTSCPIKTEFYRSTTTGFDTNLFCTTINGSSTNCALRVTDSEG